MKEKKPMSNEKIAMTVSSVTMAGNILLAAGKFIIGLLAHSEALVSDAIHSASDVFSTVIVMIGIKISAKAPDDDHPYGHDRFECACGIILSILLSLTGIGIGYSAIQHITDPSYVFVIPGIAALVAAVFSIVTKELMFRYTINAAKKIKSTALSADAWHHRSDALSSIGSFIGILGARLGYPKLDAIASIVICLFILKAAYDICKDSFDKLLDTACDAETIEKMRQVITAFEGVHGIDVINTRMFASRIYIDVEIAADGNITLFKAHEIAENVHNAIENNFTDVKHCMVHVNPCPCTKEV